MGSQATRRAVLFILLIPAAWISFEAGRTWLADRWLTSAKPDLMKKGAALVSDDADGWDRLGRYYLLTFSDPDVPRAVAYFQRATEIDPLSENYWIDLGSAKDVAGDPAGARDAYQRAVAVYPTSAVAAWNYGNFLLRSGDDQLALAEIQRAVRANPDLLTLAISRVWRSSQDINELLSKVIPADTDSYLRAIDFFGSIHEAPAGMAIWQRVVDSKQPFAFSRVFNFIEELIRENEGEDARRIWNEAANINNLPLLASSTDSPVSDGLFRAAFPNGGLGWRWSNTPGASIDFDSSTPDKNGRSIRIDFSGGVNLELIWPQQYLAVEPSRAYHFHAAMRTDQISTESGIQFEVEDPVNGGAVQISTDALTGSHPWTSEDLDFTTPAQTHFLRIRLNRSPSRMFENELSGTVWIADVSINSAQPTSRP